MWFFMNTCYVMSIVTLAMLVLGFFQSFGHFIVIKANHLTFMVLISMVYFFTETLVIFFFVGTGVSIKEYVLEHKLTAEFQKQSFQVKMKLYPPLLLNMLYMIILFILVGAVDTHRISAWIYYSLFLFCIIDYIRIKIIQNKCFKDNTKIILNMSGLKADF